MTFQYIVLFWICVFHYCWAFFPSTHHWRLSILINNTSMWSFNFQTWSAYSQIIVISLKFVDSESLNEVSLFLLIWNIQTYVYKQIVHNKLTNWVLEKSRVITKISNKCRWIMATITHKIIIIIIHMKASFAQNKRFPKIQHFFKIFVY